VARAKKTVNLLTKDEIILVKIREKSSIVRSGTKIKMAMLGDLGEFALPDILQMFERASKTGQLSIWAPSGIFRVWFYQGRVIAALTPERPQQLRQLLIDAQAIDQRTALQLKVLSQLEEPLGAYLKKQSLISSAQLATVFRQQLKVGLYNLFTLRAGQFRFAANVPLPYDEMTGMSKGGMDAAMEGLRNLESFEPFTKDLPQPDSTLLKMTSELPLVKLSNLEWGIWERINSQTPIRVIAEQLKTDLLEVRQACLRLIQVGLTEEIPASLGAIPVLASKPVLTKTASHHSELAKGSAPEPAPHAVSQTLLSRLASVLKARR
jgi:Domain of unknown function (DUF4388)